MYNINYIINNIVFWLYTDTSLTEFAVIVCLCIYLPDDDLVEVETGNRNISDKWLFLDCAACWIKYCIIKLISRNMDYVKLAKNT
jgi:hypothetical protein